MTKELKESKLLGICCVVNKDIGWCTRKINHKGKHIAKNMGGAILGTWRRK